MRFRRCPGRYVVQETLIEEIIRLCSDAVCTGRTPFLVDPLSLSGLMDED